MNIRKRDKMNNEEFSIETNSNSIKSDKNVLKLINKLKNQKNSNKVNLSLIYWFFLFIFLFILFNFAIRFQSSCEFKKDFINFNIKNEKIDNFEPTFNDSIARFHLKSIIKLGRRPAGSAANEVHTVNYIVKYIQKIVNQYSMIINSNLIVTIDEHVSKLNSFPLIVFGTQHMSSIYDQLRSVVVRIHDKHSDISEAALMINCHYDSFFGGLGASDDLTSCVVMLETLHSLLKYQPISLRADIILLFNGAEENFLQASHAFVTQHKWAKDVKLFVNLEAAGSGGRQMIFQASQQHPWIVDELGQILRQPFASVIGQEIFSANLIPSDTDYRIFRDFGNIPGVDFAFITNGYIYHTSYDTEDRIPQTCLRHTGDNLLKIVLHLANVDFIAGKQSSEDTILSSQRVIFFDFLGFILISYTEFTGLCLNVVFILISVLIVAYHVVRRPSGYLKQLLITIISQILWAFSNFLLSLLLGYLLHRFGCKMSWYSLRYNVIGLFVAPLLGYYFIYHLHLSQYLFRIPATTSSSECHRHSCLIIISVFTIILTFFRLLSCYFIAMWLIFCFLNEFLSNILQNFNISEFNTNVLNIVREALSYTLPMTYYFYMSYTLYDVFIPILGRTGPGYADMVISGLTGLTFVVPGWLFASSVYITSISNKKWIIFILIHFSISYYIFINSTQFGFPYNQSEINPRKQRIFINHVTRNIRNSRGQTQISDSGLWILSLDTNNVAFVKESLEQALNVPMNDIYCELRPYCGYPLLFPFANVIDKSLWIPQLPHKLTPAASILVLNKVTHMSGMVNVTMQVDGPPQSPIYIMTPESMRVLSWSLSADPPQPIDMPSYADKNYRHYFIFYGYGDKPLTPLTFWITFLPKFSGIQKKPKDEFENQIEVAVAAHYLLAKTEQIEGLLHLMPKWTAPTFLASSYEHIVVDFEEHLSFNQ